MYSRLLSGEASNPETQMGTRKKKKFPKKSLLPLSKRSIPARQKVFRKYHSTLAKYLIKKCVSPQSCSHQQRQSVYLVFHPCQGGRQGMRHPLFHQSGVRESWVSENLHLGADFHVRPHPNPILVGSVGRLDFQTHLYLSPLCVSEEA